MSSYTPEIQVFGLNIQALLDKYSIPLSAVHFYKESLISWKKTAFM